MDFHTSNVISRVHTYEERERERERERMRNGLSNDSKLCTDIVLTLIEPSKYLVSSRLVTYNPLKYIIKNAINQEALYMSYPNILPMVA